MKPALVILLVACIAAVAAAQPFGGAFAPIPIPDGAPGCNNPGALLTASAADGGGAGSVISDVDITVSFGPPGHTWYGDVVLTVTYCGVSATLMGTPGPDCGDSSDLLGTYTIDDEAAGTFDAAAAAAGAGAAVPPGSYVGDSPLAVFDGLPTGGTWTFCVWDEAGGDTGAWSGAGGVVTAAAGPGAWTFSLSQCRPGAPLIIENAGGIAGGTFLNAATGVPGATPGGWLFGLDIDIDLLVAEVLGGEPFFGELSASGSFYQLVPVVPPGVTLYFISLQYLPLGLGGGWIAPHSPPVAGGGVYTTL